MDFNDPRFDKDQAKAELVQLLGSIRSSDIPPKNKVQAVLISLASTVRDVNEDSLWGVFKAAGLNTDHYAVKTLITFWTTAYYKEGLIEVVNMVAEDSPVSLHANSAKLMTPEEVEHIRAIVLESRESYVV